MRYATVPHWVFVMLIVMGVGFMAGAAAFVGFVPAPTGAIVGAVWLAMGAGMVYFPFRTLRRASDDERLKRDGTPATATQRGAKMTGWFINGVPQWALQLHIEGNGAPYDTTLKLQTFSPPADGASFAVRVDPMRPNHIVFADGGDALAAAAAPDVAAATAPRDPAETVRLLAKLDALRTSGALSQAEFDAVRKGLLGEG